jgi:hypothetical protein
MPFVLKVPSLFLHNWSKFVPTDGIAALVKSEADVPVDITSPLLIISLLLPQFYYKHLII